MRKSVDRCEQIGYIKRREYPDDGRSVLIEVTDKSLEVLKTLLEIHLEEIKRIGVFKEN